MSTDLDQAPETSVAGATAGSAQAFEETGPSVAPLRPPRAKASLTLLIALTALSFVADAVSKAWVKSELAGVEPGAHGVRHMELLKGHLVLILAQNPGGAWSFLRTLPDSLRRPFFLVVSAAAMVFIVAVYRRIDREQIGMKIGLPLALGGAAGNLADRVRYGWVVDFIDVFIMQRGRELHWPTFNVADMAIVVGVSLMVLDMLFRRRTPPGTDDASKSEPCPSSTQ
jgi:signal peptidase II